MPDPHHKDHRPQEVPRLHTPPPRRPPEPCGGEHPLPLLHRRAFQPPHHGHPHRDRQGARRLLHGRRRRRRQDAQRAGAAVHGGPPRARHAAGRGEADVSARAAGGLRARAELRRGVRDGLDQGRLELSQGLPPLDQDRPVVPPRRVSAGLQAGQLDLVHHRGHGEPFHQALGVRAGDLSDDCLFARGPCLQASQGHLSPAVRRRRRRVARHAPLLRKPHLPLRQLRPPRVLHLGPLGDPAGAPSSRVRLLQGRRGPELRAQQHLHGPVPLLRAHGAQHERQEPLPAAGSAHHHPRPHGILRSCTVRMPSAHGSRLHQGRHRRRPAD
mmetsp:Transcript_42797/g.107123  ORF Transcript_42797/g.107123 Transcript_42797/m.107123 type:complete len:327 (+) Transcript_42797:1203-2183(+)